MRTLEARSAELASKVDQLEALSEVGEAVRSSLDLDEVLETIVTNAVRLTGTDGGSIMEYDEASGVFFVRARLRQQPGPARSPAGDHDRARHDAGRPRDRSTAARSQVADLDAVPLDPHLQALYDDGWRSVLAVPMLRQDQMLGALVIRRRTPGTFSRRRRAAADLRQPVGAGDPQRPALPRARDEAASSRWPASTSPSSWPACPTSCARR